ncbi:beta-glucan synthesis-associated protein-domain-containing protein [Amanita rubescens]|nr:beta-glucan synthesis-associated protein-domain-containing protein [Amanita rubescens]
MVEPMFIVLGISANWQTTDLTTTIFPAELSFDYVRVYQRKGSTNVGCNPAGYPTMKYIDNHIDARIFLFRLRLLFFFLYSPVDIVEYLY